MRRAVMVAVGGGILALVGAAALIAWHQSSGDSVSGTVHVRDLASVAGEYVSVNDVGAPAPLVAGTTVRLTVEKDRVSAHAGCNSMQGAARVDNGRLVVADLMTTELGCPPAVAAQEQWVVTMLQAQPRLERSGPYLYLSWDGHWLGLSSDPADQAVVRPSA